MPAMTQENAISLARLLVDFLETGNVPDGLFTPDVFCDFTMPKWRLQSEGVAGLVALRKAGHPGPGTLPMWRCDATPTGFVLEFEEQWEQDGALWYSRELARADAPNGAVSALSVYCTGDWDETLRAKHAAGVKLIRP